MREYLWSKFLQNRAIFGGERAQKLPKRGHFMDAASARKHLKIYDLTTENSYTNEAYHNYVPQQDV